MFTGRKRYSGVKGKIVEYVQTYNEQDTLYFHVHFTDKTFIGISVVPYVRVHSADLYDASTGDYEVLKDYIRTGPGKKEASE